MRRAASSSTVSPRGFEAIPQRAQDSRPQAYQLASLDQNGSNAVDAVELPGGDMAESTNDLGLGINGKMKLVRSGESRRRTCAETTLSTQQPSAWCRPTPLGFSSDPRMGVCCISRGFPATCSPLEHFLRLKTWRMLWQEALAKPCFERTFLPSILRWR